MEKSKESLDFEAAQAKKHEAENKFKLENKAFKKLVKEASNKFMAADKARAKARHEFRLAKKAHFDDQDRIQIEQSQKKAVK